MAFEELIIEYPSLVEANGLPFATFSDVHGRPGSRQLRDFVIVLIPLT